jgi:hypothetical protein
VSDLPVSSDVDSLLQSPTKADFRIRLGLGSAALVSTSTFVAASAVTTTVRSSGSADDTKVPTEKAVRDALTATSSSITQIYTELPSTGLTLGTRIWLIGQEDPADNGLYELENVSSTPTWVQKQHFMGEATTFSNTVPDVSSAQAGDQVYITAGTFWGMILEKQDDAWRYRGQFLEPKKGSIYNSTQRGQIGSYLESGELFWYALTAVDGPNNPGFYAIGSDGVQSGPYLSSSLTGLPTSAPGVLTNDGEGNITWSPQDSDCARRAPDAASLVGVLNIYAEEAHIGAVPAVEANSEYSTFAEDTGEYRRFVANAAASAWVEVGITYGITSVGGWTAPSVGSTDRNLNVGTLEEAVDLIKTLVGDLITAGILKTV